jgi:biopolymer transport protein ExbB
VRILVLVLLVGVVQAAFAGKKDHARAEQKALLEELTRVKKTYEKESERLRTVTESRWSVRERQVEDKAQLQRSIEAAEGEVEQLYSEIARIREEALLRENSVLTLKGEVDEAREQLSGISGVIEGIIGKEEDAARTGFPIRQQQRSLHLQELQREIRSTPQRIQHHCGLLLNYYLKNISLQTTNAVSRETILGAGNTMVEAPVLRLGTAVAFGVSDTGTAWYLGYTGNSSGSPFEWVKLTDEAARANLVSSMPQWLSSGKVNGNLHVDVLQNTHSGDLLGVERKTAGVAIKDFLRKGGIVMIPLGLICLWAFILLVNRLVLYSSAHSRDNRFIDAAIEFLNKNNHDEARRFAKRSKGVLAKILSTCLRHSKWKRPVAEKAVKELLLAEVPALDKHLDTLAVLAGAAPLLGLLGTVTGMITMFESITRFGTGDPKLLASGISEALVTTETGLAIAIPVLLIHNFLRNRRNHIQSDMEMYAMRILNRLWPEE